MTPSQLAELKMLEDKLKALKAQAGIYEDRKVQIRKVNGVLVVPSGITGEKLTKILNGYGN